MTFAAVASVGSHVRLDPLTLQETSELFTALDDAGVWRWLSAPRPSTVDDMRELLRTVVFSITSEAWPRVRDPLVARLARY